MTVRQTMDALAGGEDVTATALAELSNLAGPDLDVLREGWPRLSSQTKEEYLERLLDIAEDNLELDFDEIYRLSATDADPRVRVAAANGLADSEDERVSVILVNMLREDPAAEVRAAAASGLTGFAILDAFEDLPARYAEPLRAALRGALTTPGEDLEVQARALETSGAIGYEPWAQQQIGAHYIGDDRRMSLAALRAMGQSCDAHWLPQVTDELESEDPERRQAAAIAAGNIASEESVDAVGSLIADEDPEVAEAAVWALGEIGGPAAVGLLEDLLSETEDEEQRDAIEEALVAARFKESPLGFFEDLTDMH